MAHKKAGGSSRNGRDSNSQRLGVKVFGGRASSPATSWRAARRSSIPVAMSAWAATTRQSLTSGHVEYRTSQAASSCQSCR